MVLGCMNSNHIAAHHHLNKLKTQHIYCLRIYRMSHLQTSRWAPSYHFLVMWVALSRNANTNVFLRRSSTVLQIPSLTYASGIFRILALHFNMCTVLYVNSCHLCTMHVSMYCVTGGLQLIPAEPVSRRQIPLHLRSLGEQKGLSY